MIGRAVVGVYGRKGRNKNPIYQGKNGDLLKFYNGVKTEDKKVLQYRRVPYLVWIVGLMFVGLGCYLMYVVTTRPGDPGTIKGFNQGLWWQYFISALIIFIGVLFTLGAKIENTRFDRNEGKLVVQKRNIFCKTKLHVRELLAITNVSIVKRGLDTISNNTLHYKIVIQCEGTKSLEILETKDRARAKKRYIEIANLLGLDFHLDTIPLNDESRSPNRV